MTEGEWMYASSGSQDMLRHLRTTCSVTRTRVGKRKLRLFGCACCRLIWPYLTRRLRHAVEMSERFADGKATLHEMTTVRKPLMPLLHGGYNAWDRGVAKRISAHMAVSTTSPQAFHAAFNMTTFSLVLAGDTLASS
jgi:hypothetical protein